MPMPTGLTSQAVFCCKKIQIMAFSNHPQRKDAQIGGFKKQNAKRAMSARRVAELL
jgi:hypothetical protein